MKYANIKYFDVANGEGIRTSLFVSGCNNHCKGCFNLEAQNFDYGKEFTGEVIQNILDSIDKPYIKGLSILGGDPIELENQGGVLRLIKAFRERFEQTKNIWMWTGYIYDKDLINGGRRYISGITNEILNNIDYLVDGPFIESKKELGLLFKGSSNQRLINMKKTLKQGDIVIYK